MSPVFAARAARTCKHEFKVPKRSDYIQVLWILDHVASAPETWCNAEVLHIFDASEQKCLAKGVILYPRNEYWDEQISTVEFLRDHLLRCAVDESESSAVGGEESEGEEERSILSWRYIPIDRPQEDPDASDDDWDCNVTVSRGMKRGKDESHDHADESKGSGAVTLPFQSKLKD